MVQSGHHFLAHNPETEVDIDELGYVEEGPISLASGVNIVSPEEIQRLMTRKPTPSLKTKKVFGAFNIHSFYQLVNDPALMEIDFLISQGRLTMDEAFEYTMIMPEYDLIRKKIDQLANSFVSHLVGSGRIRSAIQKSVPSKLSNQVLKNGYYSPGRALGEIQTELRQFIGTETTKSDSYRNSRLNALAQKTEVYLSAAILAELSKREYTQADRDCLYTYFFNALNNRFGEIGESFTGLALLEFQKNTNQVIQEHQGAFQDMILAYEQSFQKPLSDQELAEENQMMKDEVLKLSQDKATGSRAQKIASTIVQIEGGKYLKSRAFKEQSICIARIHFKAGQSYYPASLRSSNGVFSINHHLNKATVEYYLDRTTGDLCFPLVELSIKNSFTPRQYAVLKYIFYNLFLDHQDRRPIQVISLQNTTAQEIAKIVNSPLAIDCIINVPDPAKSGPINVSEIDSQIVEETPDTIWDRDWQICREKLRSKTGRRLLSAFKRILGQKSIINVDGSHYTFRGTNGRVCQFWVHSSGNVNLRAVKNMLERLEISPARLLEEFA